MNFTEIIQGATYTWQVDLSNYLPSDGWTLKYYLRGVGTGLDITATDEDDIFQVEITATNSAALTIGSYAWQSFAEKGADKKLIASGNLKIKEGFATISAATTFDNRSAIKIALDNIDAMLANKATLDQQRYVIGNRQLDRIPIPDLLNLRKEYQKFYNQEVRAEAAKNGKFKVFTPYYVKFKRPE